MKRIWILLLICALLLTACKKQPEFVQSGEESVVSAPSEEDVAPPGSDGPSAPQTEQSDPASESAANPLQVEACVTEVKENGAVMGVNCRGLLSAIFVRTDVQTDVPMPELRAGYRVQLRLKEAIPDGVLPTVTPDSILFLEDMGKWQVGDEVIVAHSGKFTKEEPWRGELIDIQKVS